MLKIFLNVILVLFCIFLIVFVIYNCLVDNVSPFISSYDQKEYSVRKIGNSKTRQDAANYLAILKNKADILINYMYENQLPDKETSERIYTRWLNCELKETSSSETSAAYTLNKSSEVRICIRKDVDSFEDINTSMFVLLHELSHVASISYNHTEEFKNNFSYITSLASALGLYYPEDFLNEPKSYCGTIINTTPCSENICSFGTI